MPVMVMALSAVFLGESPQWYHLPGMLLIFGGIFLTVRSGRRRRRTTTPVQNGGANHSR